MTIKPSFVSLADDAAEAIRELNHRTLRGCGDALPPCDLSAVLGALSTLAARLPQLLGQLAATLNRQLRAGQLIVDSWATSDAAAFVAHVEHALREVVWPATQLGCALDVGHQAAAHLAVRGP